MFIFSTESLKVLNEYFKIATHDNVQCPLHIHYCMEVVYVSDGEVVMNVNGKDRVIPEGNATLILPFEQHSFHTAKNSHCLVVEFSPEIIMDFYDMIKEKLLLTEVFKIDKNIIDLCGNILPNETISSVQMKSVLYPICNEILNRCEFGSSGKVPDKTFIEAIRYLQQNFTSEGLTLTSTATALGIHSVYLSRLFAKNSGMSFTKYVNLLRCTYAAEKIRNEKELNLSQIAYESGFGSIRSFNREFMECFDITPKQYRQK